MQLDPAVLNVKNGFTANESLFYLYADDYSSHFYLLKCIEISICIHIHLNDLIDNFAVVDGPNFNLL